MRSRRAAVGARPHADTGPSVAVMSDAGSRLPSNETASRKLTSHFLSLSSTGAAPGALPSGLHATPFAVGWNRPWDTLRTQTACRVLTDTHQKKPPLLPVSSNLHNVGYYK